MTHNLVATAQIEISAMPSLVWQALTDPDQIKQYMFGSIVETDWKPGSPIVWKGTWQGKPYTDKGEIVEVDPRRRLVVTHYSPMSGKDDRPENYHTLTYELEDHGDATSLTLRQDHNLTADEVQHSSETWSSMLEDLKRVVERDGS